MIYEVKNPESVRNLFGDWPESLIWSCLQGVMGKLYATHPDRPESAMAILGDFSYYAGKPDPELTAYRPDWYQQDFITMVPQSSKWEPLISHCYGKKARKTTRYAIRKEAVDFDRKQLLQAAGSLPCGCRLQPIDENYYKMCLTESWSRDFTAHFTDYAAYQKLGLGFVAVKDGRILSGASSYSRYREGIEVVIATREEFRRQGLAYACSAKLILECLDRNLYPCWDAQNLWSAALAQKLGYRFSHEYNAWEIQGY